MAGVEFSLVPRLLSHLDWFLHATKLFVCAQTKQNWQNSEHLCYGKTFSWFSTIFGGTVSSRIRIQSGPSSWVVTLTLDWSGWDLGGFDGLEWVDDVVSSLVWFVRWLVLNVGCSFYYPKHIMYFEEVYKISPTVLLKHFLLSYLEEKRGLPLSFFEDLSKEAFTFQLTCS